MSSNKQDLRSRFANDVNGVWIAISAVVLLALLFYLAHTSLQAADADKFDRNRFIDTYIKAAFAAPDGRLVKMNATSPIFIDTICNVSCSATTDAIQRIIPSKRFSIQSRARIQGNSKITLLVVNSLDDLSAQRLLNDPAFTLAKGENIYIDKSRAEECASFTIFKEQTIRSIAIVVVASSNDPRRDAACFAVQMQRSSGLKLTFTFDDLMRKKNNFRDLSDSKSYSQLHSMMSFAGLQFSPDTRSGMSAEEFRQVASHRSTSDLVGY